MTQARYDIADRVATITLDGPERKNPLTFELYAELRDWFRKAGDTDAVKAVVLTGAGENFCSGGDVHEIIGPLTKRTPTELLEFTQMTGDLVKAMRAAPQPIVAAIDGICVGAGAILAMASDLRYGTARSKVAFLFVRVGLAGCDMGACAMLPRIIGLGRASELLYTGRSMPGAQALEWGFYTELCEPDGVLERAQAVGARDRARTDGRACDDQTDAARRVGVCRWISPSMRKRGRRRFAWRPPTSGARTKPSSTKRPRHLKETDATHDLAGRFSTTPIAPTLPALRSWLDAATCSTTRAMRTAAAALGSANWRRAAGSKRCVDLDVRRSA